MAVRVAQWAGGAAIVLVVVLLLLRVLLLTPFATFWAESMLDGRELGDGWTLEAVGVEGDLFGRVQIEELAIQDAQGEWLRIEKARLHWNPLPLLWRQISVRELTAGRIDITRRPQSAEANKEPTRSTTDRQAWSLKLDRGGVNLIKLAEGVAGPASTFTLDLHAHLDAGALQSAEVTFARADALGDVLFVTAGRNEAGRLTGSAQLEAVAGGPLAAMLQAPDSVWSLGASVRDTGDGLSGEADLTIDEQEVISLDGDMGNAGGEIVGHIDFTAAPHTRQIAERLGSRLELRAVAAPVRADLTDLSLQADSDALSVSFVAPVDIARPFDVMSGDLAVVVAQPTDFLGTSDWTSGALRMTGEVVHAESITFSGVASLQSVEGAGLSVSRIAGPVEIAAEDGQLTLATALTALEMSAPAELGAILGDELRTNLEARFDMSRRVVDIIDASVSGPHLDAKLHGDVDVTRGAFALDMTGGLALLEPSFLGATGALDLTAQLQRRNADDPAEFTLNVRGDGIALADSHLTNFVGASPQTSASVVIDTDGAVSGEAQLGLAQASIEAVGGMGGDQSLFVDVDGAASGPWPVGPVEIAGAAALAAQLRGTLDQPSLRVEARVDEVAAGERALEDVRVRLEAHDLLNGARGRLQLDALYADEAGSLASTFGVDDGRVVLNSIDGRWRGTTLSGEAAIGGGAPPFIALEAVDARGLASVSVDLLDRNGVYLLVDANAVDTALGSGVFVETGSFRAEGPLNAIGLQAAAVGDGPAPFDMALSGALSIEPERSVALVLSPQGRIGGGDVEAIRPLTVSWSDGDVSLLGMLSASGGRIEVESSYGAEGIEGRLDWADVPVALFDALRDEARLAGRLHGELSLSGREVVTGQAEARVVDARLATSLPGVGVDVEATATLLPDRLEFQLSATDPAGLNAKAVGAAPVRVSASPLAVDLSSEEMLRAAITAVGPISGLWAIIGADKVDVAGDLDANIDVAGTLDDPLVSGEAKLTNGRVEDSVIGLRLQDVGARALFDGERIVVTDVVAGDGLKGKVTGSGEVRLQQGDASRGEVGIALSSYRIANRDDAVMTASGDVGVVFDEGAVNLFVDMQVDDAEFAPVGATAGGGAVTPMLEVVEINRPADLSPLTEREANSRLVLDARVRADRRVFVRAPGLESEWSFDVRVQGDGDEQSVRGSATLSRGEFDVAGERFEFDEGTITFRGDVDSARLDLTARRDASDLTALLRISGTVAAPEISLESTPAFPEDEILARVLFGRSASELTALEAAQLAGALAQLARGGLGVTDMLRQELGLDRLRVGGDSENGAIVTGGKYIADGVYLEVGARGEGGAVAAIEWEIRPRLELVSRFGADDETEIALRWRRDY